MQAITLRSTNADW